MKKLISTLFVLITSFAFAQDFTVTNGDNGEITDGEVFTFTSLGAEANIHIQINNNSEQNLYFKVRAESGENTSGVAVNFCFGQVCLPLFNLGQYVPPTIQDNVTIIPGGTNDINDKFFITTDAVIENTPVIFEFGLYQYDSADQDQTTGTKVLGFSYQYSPNASTPNMTLQKLGVQVNNTLVNNEFSFTTTSEMAMELFDINGRNVASQNVNEGTNLYNASGLNAGIYIAKFIDKQGQTASVKIVKQ